MHLVHGFTAAFGYWRPAKLVQLEVRAVWLKKKIYSCFG